MNSPGNDSAKPDAPHPLDRLEAAFAPRRARIAALAVVLLTAFLVYSHTLLFQFVYDDTPQIVENQYIHGWSHWLELFHIHVWAQQFAGGTYYRPFFLLLLLTEYSLFKLNTLAWHFVSVLMHVGVTASVYWLATKFTRTRWAALLAALLFGIYPIHVESVAWVSGITDPLVAIFSITSIASYINFRRQKHRAAWLAGSLVLFACALFSKETAVIVLPLLALYEWFFDDGGSSNRIIVRLAPLLLFVLAFAMYLDARFLVLHALRQQITPLPWQAVLYTAPHALWFYAQHLLWPVHLSLMYNLPYFIVPNLRHVVLPWIALIAILFVIVAVIWRRGSPAVKFFAWWMLLPILLVLDFRYFPYEEAVHDRYLYLPSVGLVILAALAYEAVVVRLRGGWVRVAGMVCALLLVLLAAGTVRESFPWSSNLSLYAHAVERSPRSVKARNALATEFFQRQMYPQAIAEYKVELQLEPGSFAANYNLGGAYLGIRKYAEAETLLQRATEIDPNQSNAWLKLGETRMYRRNFAGAEPAILRALQIDPTGRGYHFILGELYAAEGRFATALTAMQTEVQLYPDDEVTRYRAAELAARVHP